MQVLIFGPHFRLFSIHAVMYAYFGARAAGVKVPVDWAAWITRAQIAQMIWNMFTLSIVVGVMEFGSRECLNSRSFAYPIMGVLGLFTVMFLNFFIQSYLKGGKVKKISQKQN